jgi:glycosyltransferase involved in cell wall biosynthesis
LASLVSIIIPVYNASQWIESVLQSCLEQSYKNLEVICIDDGSSDDSKEIIHKCQDSRVYLFDNPKKGAQHARNFGAELAKGDFILFLDSDDLLAQEKIEKQVAFLEDNPQFDVAYSDWEIHTYAANGSKTVGPVIHYQYPCFATEILENNWSPPFNYLMRKGVVEDQAKRKGWNVNLEMFQDRHYFTSLALNGAKFGYCKAASSIYNRWSKDSVSQKHAREFRLQSQKNLVLDFLRQIDNSEFNRKKKKLFKRIIFTELMKIQHGLNERFDKRIRLSNIHWNQVGGMVRSVQLLLSLAKQRIFG